MDRAADDDQISVVESLYSSSPPPPVSLSSYLSLPVSCSSSPLLSSRQVTARLYSTLQHSREQEVKGHQADTHRTLTPRQVSFKVASPLVTMTTAASSDRLNVSQEAEFGLSACSSSDLRISGVEEAESEPEPTTDELDLKLQRGTKLTSGRRHIEEMENVRSHLQTMLRGRAADTHELLPSVLQHQQDNESDTTSHLLNGVEELFPRYSRLRADFDSTPYHSVSELQVIRESLERERARRKHSEQQLLAVQNKALELQQQVALAVSADRKKDIMIEQLDKTLEKVVEGWRRHEREKSEGVRRLQEEKEAAESVQQKQREVLAGLEKSLSEAAETLDKEQKRNTDLQSTNKQLERDVAELRVCVGDLEQQVERLHTEVEEKKSEVETLHTHSLDLQQQLEQHTLQAKHTHTHLQQELTRLTQQLETERDRVGQEVQLREEAQSRHQQLQQDLEETRRERDTARVDRALDQARFEAQRSQWEVELRLSVEQQVTERLATVQEEHANATAKLREQHRKQLLDLSARHARELSVQSDEFRVQLKDGDERQQQLTRDCSRKIAQLQEELVSMETSKQRLEMQREELVSRLQGMMRSHWAEALRLLTNQEQIEEVLSPLSLRDKPHSSPRTEDTSSFSTAHTLSTVAPQAVVLQLCRQRRVRGQGDSAGDRGRGSAGDSAGDRERAESDFSLLNHSHIFSPLEPVQDDTHLTGDLWDRTVPVDRQTLDRGGDGGREHRERERGGETVTLHSAHLHTRDPFRDPNSTRVPSDRLVCTQPVPDPGPNTASGLRPNRVRASSGIRANHSSDTEAGQRDVSKQAYGSTAIKTPPTDEQPLSVKVRAASSASSVSALCDERQNDLQFYIAKLLERSPGEPLEEHHMEQSRNKAETQSANSGVSSQVEVEQLAELLTLPPTHTTPQLQQLLNSLIRSGEISSDQNSTNLEHRLAQQDKREQRQSAARSMHNTTTRGRRTGPQGQRSGSKVNAWR